MRKLADGYRSVCVAQKIPFFISKLSDRSSTIASLLLRAFILMLNDVNGS